MIGCESGTGGKVVAGQALLIVWAENDGWESWNVGCVGGSMAGAGRGADLGLNELSNGSDGWCGKPNEGVAVGANIGCNVALFGQESSANAGMFCNWLYPCSILCNSDSKSSKSATATPLSIRTPSAFTDSWKKKKKKNSMAILTSALITVHLLLCNFIQSSYFLL